MGNFPTARSPLPSHGVLGPVSIREPPQVVSFASAEVDLQVLGEEDVDAAAVAEVDMRLLDLEMLDDAVFVAGFLL